MRIWKLAMVALVALPVLVSMPRPAVATDSQYSFNLAGPNTAVALTGPHAGDTIRVTGSGTFDPGVGTVVASGSFTHFHADGTAHEKGAWEATGFTSFVGFGGPNPGLQGGVLVITVTHFPDGGEPHEDIAMSVASTINAPPGYQEGTTVGDFTEKTSGRVLFHLGS